MPTRKAPPTIDDPDRGDVAAPPVSLQLERGQRMRLSDQLYGQIFDRIASGQLKTREDVGDHGASLSCGTGLSCLSRP